MAANRTEPVTIDQALSDVENILKRETFDDAIGILARLKERTTYETHPNGYLVDYFHGQALFRKENDFDIEAIDRIIGLFQRSLQLKPDFPDCHLLIGYVYMRKHRMTGDGTYGTSAITHFEQAAKGIPFMASECQLNIRLIRQRMGV